MNTFVCEADFAQAAARLDWRRLGKERLEVAQMLRALSGETIPIVRKSCDEVAAGALAAALPHLFPDLYVTRDRGDVTVWRDDPEHPDRPEHVGYRELETLVGALLPDRSDDVEDPS